MAESGGRKPPDGESGEDKDNAAQRDGSAQSTGSTTQDSRHNTENKPLTGRKEETQKRKLPLVPVKEEGKAKAGKFVLERKEPFEKEDKVRKTKVEIKTSASKRKEVDIEIENGSVKKPDETDYASYKSETDGDFPGNTSEDLFSSYVLIEENDTTACSLDPATVKTKEEETKSSDETLTTNDSTNDENIEIDDEEKETPDHNTGVKDENKERTNEYKKSLEGSVNAETVEMKKEETEASDETVTTNDKNKEKPDENKGMKDENKEISDKDQERLDENMETSYGNKPTGMTIFVSTLTGKRIAIHVQPNECVEIVKSKIKREMDIHHEKQKLIFKNKELEDGKPLLDYDITDRSTVHMVVKSQENAETPEDEISKETLEKSAAASDASTATKMERKKNRQSEKIQAQASAENIKGEKQDIVKDRQGLEAGKAGQPTQLQINQEENQEGNTDGEKNLQYKNNLSTVEVDQEVQRGEEDLRCSLSWDELEKKDIHADKIVPAIGETNERSSEEGVSQPVHNETEQEKDLALTRSSSNSSFDKLSQGPDTDKEAGFDEGDALVQFQMKSQTHLPDYAEKGEECDTVSASLTLSDKGTNDTDKSNISNAENKENKLDSENFSKTETASSEATKEAPASVKKYSLKRTGDIYLLLKGDVPIKLQELKGKENVCMEENLIIVDGEPKYYITDENDCIRINEIEVAVSGGNINNASSNESGNNQSSNQVPTTYQEEENTHLDSEKKHVKEYKVRATTPHAEDLLNSQEAIDNQMAQYSQSVTNKDSNKYSNKENEIDGDVAALTDMMGSCTITGQSKNPEDSANLKSSTTSNSGSPVKDESSQSVERPVPAKRKNLPGTADEGENGPGHVPTSPTPPPRRKVHKEKNHSDSTQQSPDKGKMQGVGEMENGTHSLTQGQTVPPRPGSVDIATTKSSSSGKADEGKTGQGHVPTSPIPPPQQKVHNEKNHSDGTQQSQDEGKMQGVGEMENGTHSLTQGQTVPPRPGSVDIATTKSSSSEKNRLVDVPVKLFHGEQSQLFHLKLKPKSDYVKLLYVLHNENASVILNEKLKGLGVKIQEKCVVIRVKEELKQEDRSAKIHCFLKMAVDRIEELHCEEIKLENGGLEMLQVIMNSDLARKCLLYAHYFQKEQLFVYVCHSKRQEQAQNEYLKAFELRNVNHGSSFVKECIFNLGFIVVCEWVDVHQKLATQFPGVRFQIGNDPENKTCKCYLEGPNHVVLEEAVAFLQEDVANGHPFNSIPFSSVQKIKNVNKKVQQNILANKLKCLVSECDKPEEVHFNVNTDAERVTVVGLSQSVVDTIISKLRYCIDEVELNLSYKVCEKLLSEIQTEDKDRIYISSYGKKCLCIGSSSVVKMFKERCKKYTVENKECLAEEESQNLSLKSYLPKKHGEPRDLKKRTAELKDFSVFKLIKNRLQQDSLNELKNVEISEIERNGRLGFMITGYDDNSIYEAEMCIKRFETEIREDSLSVGISEKQVNEFDVFKSDLEERCNVIVNLKKENKVTGTVLGEGFDHSQIVSRRKEHVFAGGMTLRVTLGNAEEHWENLIVKIMQGKGEPMLTKPAHEKMLTQLYVPKWSDGEPGEDDGTHSLQASAKRVLDLVAANGCTHVCLPLDKRYGWPLRKLMKQILKPLIAFMEKKEAVPVVFELCLCDNEELMLCHKIICETRNIEDSESDTSEDPPALPERNKQREQIEVCVVSGKLNDFQADVLVNTTSPTLDLKAGAVSKSLHDRAGNEMQKECKRRYPLGIKEGDIAVTKGYKLNCKNVFHGSVMEFKAQHEEYCLKKLQDFILACLRKAVEFAQRSIAFPAIGTGNLGYPTEKVAEVMFNSVRLFNEEQKSKKVQGELCVNFVIFPADSMEIFYKLCEKFSAGMMEGKKHKPARPRPPTSRCVTLSDVKVNAMIGNVKTCGNADALIYFWNNTKLYGVKKADKFLTEADITDFFSKRDGSDKQKAFITDAGGLENRQVIHVPVKTDKEALVQGFRDGFMSADKAGISSAAVFFKVDSPFLVHQDKLGKEMIKAVKDLAGRLKHLKVITLVIETLTNTKKLFQAFEMGQENNEEITTDDISTYVDLSIRGHPADIEHAKQILCKWSLSSDTQGLKHSEDAYSQELPGASPQEPEPQSIARTESDPPSHSGMPLAGKSCLVKRESLSGYVLVSNVPVQHTYETLCAEFMKTGLPVGIKQLIYLKGSENALIICNTSDDANTLSGCNTVKPFGFKCIEKQPLGSFEYVIRKTAVEKMRKEKTLDEFRAALQELRVDVNGSVEMIVHAPTLLQIVWIRKLMEKYCDGNNYTTTSADDGFEHVVLKDEIIAEDVRDEIWKIMQIEQEEPMKRFEETCGTLNYTGKAVISKQKTGSSKNTFDNFTKVFKTFVEKFKKMEFETVEIDLLYINDIWSWIDEIDQTMNGRCCTFIPSENKVIAYFDTYEGVKQVKHHFLFKQKKIKATGRRRKVAKEGTAESGPASLQVGFRMDSEAQDSCSKYEVADFEWEKDAKNVACYKTDENIQVYVYVADILKLPVDCIVNAANNTLQHGGGVAKAIAVGAGQMLEQEGDTYIRSKGKIPVGHAMSTSAGNLPYKRVIHTVGPRWYDYHPHSPRDISRCENDLTNAVYNSFLEAEKFKLTKIALPAISAAIFGVPEDLCVSMYVRATLKYSKERTAYPVGEIHFIDRNPKIIALLQEEFNTVLVKGEVSPYFRKSHRHGQQSGNKNHDQTDLLLEKSSLIFSPEHKLTYNKKDAFFFCGNESKRLLIYNGDLLGVKQAAIVVTIDERGNEGRIARSVTKNIKPHAVYEYRQELGKKLQRHCSTGTLVVTGGYKTGFSRILHVVLPSNPYSIRLNERRHYLRTAYHNIFTRTVNVTDVEAISTTLIGIDDEKTDEVDMCADVFLEEYVSVVKEKLLQRKEPYDVHLVCRKEKNARYICSKFKEFVQEQQRSFQEMEYHRLPDDEQDNVYKKQESSANNNEELDDCVICMEVMKNAETLKCGHKYCKECIEKHFKIKKTCPTCGAVCGVITGDQPDGGISFRLSSHSHCAGYPNCGQLSVTYTFPDGRQQAQHPNPGKWYKGITRTAYLPDNTEGRKIRDMLRVAFDRKLVFTIGRSRTTGQEGVITWNDIHHKTDPRPYSQFGYPDETYLTRVKEELAAKGVTEDDIKDKNDTI